MRVCSVETCDRKHVVHGYCASHWARVKRYGDPMPDKPLARRIRGRLCDVEGCQRKHYANGYCSAHTARLARYGTVNAHEPIKEYVGYTLKDGYRWISIGGKQHAEHRVVMERILGRSLTADENVHHINGDRQDNRPENLELWLVRRQPAGQRVSDRVADALDVLERYAPEHLANKPTQLRVVA